MFQTQTNFTKGASKLGGWQDSRKHQLGASTQLCKQKTWIWDSVLLVASYTAFKKLYCLLTIVLLSVKVSHRHNHGLSSVLPKTLRLTWRHGEPKALRVALCSWTRWRRSTAQNIVVFSTLLRWFRKVSGEWSSNSFVQWGQNGIMGIFMLWT